jgi:predicted DNA-binding transcriptional regulator YafY
VRASRLVELLLLLQLRGRATAGELAATLEVSVRTVYRDIEALAAAGVPLRTETGRRGGVVLEAGYRMGDLTGLDESEARRMVLAAVPGAAGDLGVELGPSAHSVRERLLIEPEDWFTERDDVPWLVDVARGVWEGRELRIDYRSKARTSAQVVRPLGLVLKGRAWYLIARTRRGADRTFRVSRLLEVSVLAHTFDRPDGFDLAEAWATSTREFAASRPRYPVTVRVAPEGERLLGLLQEGTPPLPLAADVPRDASGWAELRLRFERPASAARLLLQLGADVEVLDPPELRDLVAEAARGLAALYA